jgi:phosphate transport system protein
MTRETLDRNIETLMDELLMLEGMVKKATLDSVAALRNRDKVLSRTVYHNDRLVNAKRFDIEINCLITIATQQAIASDLRILASILEVAGELERMGDYAKGIARINLMLGDEPLPGALYDLPRMSELVIDMLDRAVNAFLEQDSEAARIIPNEDDKVDDLFNKIYYSLVEEMMENPKIVDQANHLQWAAHNLERMADRVTNICERVIFVVEGEIMELDHSDDEWRYPARGNNPGYTP